MTEGTWVLKNKLSKDSICVDALIVKRLDASSENAPGLELVRLPTDSNGIHAYDRAPFLRINEGEKCEAVDFSLFKDLKICHNTKVLSPGVVRHRVRLTERVGVVVQLIPIGSSMAEQLMSFDGRSLKYEYSIDGKLADGCEYVRPLLQP